MTAITSPRRIQGCAIALAVALLGLTAWSVIEARRAALEQAAVDSRNLAQALQQHTLQAFQAVDLVLRGLADRLGSTDRAAMPAMLARQSAGLLQIRAMAALDADGIRIAGSGEPLGDADREADQAYFTAPRAQPGPGLYIGPPMKSPRDGRWVVPMSRRFTGASGEFAGVVMAALDAGYFQDFYDRVEVGPHGGIVLFGTDGTLYFRKPYDTANVGRNVLDRPTFREHLLHDREGTEEITPSIDLITRISSHRQLDTYPFVIVVGLAKDDVLGAWRRQAAVHLSAASVLALTVLALGFLLDREVRRRAAAEAEARGAADRFHRDKVMLEAVLNAMPDGIVLLDQRGAMLLWNDLLFQVLELERADIVDGADPTAVLTEALWARGDGALAVRDLATAAAGASVEELRLATGKWIECRMTHVPGLGCIAIYRDIAERKRREIEMVQSQHRLQAQTMALARLAEDLDLARQTAEAARIEAETASRTKSSFIAGMNHELRTPLNAILGFAQVIRDQRFGGAALPRYSEYAGHIISSGEHLLSLINDLLDLAKIEAGKMDLQAQPVDLKQLLASTILMVKETAANGRIAIDLNTPDEAIMLPADPRRLKQCFLNLVSNAVKFTPEGGRVAVSVTAGRDSVEIAVADTGIGVKPGDIAKIFEPFGQIDSPLARRHVGTGLGLPLARSLIEMHGGDLSFRSVEGSGTTVTVSLPRHRLVA